MDGRLDDDVAASVARLSEGQRACLRLVRQHMTSKEIARELGISKHTVDQRLKLAANILGVSGRTEAALLFARHDGAGIYDRVVYGQPDIAAAARLPDSSDPDESEPVAVSAGPVSPAKPAFPARLIGGPRNELTIMQRLAWSVAAILIVIVAAGIFLSGMGALGRLIVVLRGGS